MLEEEAEVIGGLLVGLNVIDCNMGIKDEDLDQPVCLDSCYTSAPFNPFIAGIFKTSGKGYIGHDFKLIKMFGLWAILTFFTAGLSFRILFVHVLF